LEYALLASGDKPCIDQEMALDTNEELAWGYDVRGINNAYQPRAACAQSFRVRGRGYPVGQDFTPRTPSPSIANRAASPPALRWLQVSPPARR
jgi:hypothetical protein